MNTFTLVAMMHESKSEHLTLRLEPKLREEIERAAKVDRRPMGSLIRNILADWIDSRSPQSAGTSA